MIYKNICSILKAEHKGITPGEAFNWLLENPGKHVYGIDETGVDNMISAFTLSILNQFLISDVSDPYNTSFNWFAIDTNFNWYITDNDIFSGNIFYTPDQYESALIEIERIKSDMNLALKIGLGFNYL